MSDYKLAILFKQMLIYDLSLLLLRIKLLMH